MKRFNDNHMSANDPAVERQDEPPEKKNIFWTERFVKLNTSWTYCVYSPKIRGYWTHWIHVAKRSKPCYKNRQLCYGGHSEDNRRWYGFLLAWCIERKRLEVIQLPPGSIDKLRGQVAKDASLRGMFLKVTKYGDKHQAPDVEVITTKIRAPETLPPDQEVLPSLKRLWQVPQDVLPVDGGEVTEATDVPTVAQEEVAPLRHQVAPYASSNGRLP